MDLDEFARSGLDDLLRFAHALIGDRGTAEDVCQEVLIRLFVSPKRPRSVDNVPAYARRMLVNEYLSWGRKWFRVRPVPELDGRDCSPDFTQALADGDALRRELAALPRRQRAALVLRFYGGMSDSEIADDLGCSVSTVRSHISRGLSSLSDRHVTPGVAGAGEETMNPQHTRSAEDLTAALTADADQAVDGRTFLATHPLTAGNPTRRHGTRVAASVVLALAVVALSLLLGRQDDHGGATPPASPGAGLMGTSWLLTEVTGSHGRVNLVRDHPSAIDLTTDGAWIEFEQDGTLLSNDGINAINGTYRATADGLELRSEFQTAAGILPPFPAWRATVMSAIGVVTGYGPVQAQRQHGQLVLSVPGYTLTFIEGPAASQTPVARRTAGPSARLSGRYRVSGGAPGLSGSPLCGSGACIAGVIDIYRGASASGQPVTSIHSGSDGRFSVALPQGVYYLRGRTSGAEVPCHSYAPVIVTPHGGHADVVCVAK